MKKHFMVALTGVFIGIAAVVLVKFGNPVIWDFVLPVSYATLPVR